MGTRNLVAVQIDGQYKIAQYGQWDGYPSGKGLEVLEFLRERMNEEAFVKALRNSSFIAPEKRGGRKRLGHVGAVGCHEA